MTQQDSWMPTIDLATWDRDWLDTEEPVELVAGLVTVTPSERWGNVYAVSRLADLLNRSGAEAIWAVQQMDVLLSEVPATVRRPDLTLVRTIGPNPQDRRLRPESVLLVVETVSPSSVETDWLIKRAEYAAAGIPRYLVVDLRADEPRMALFSAPGPEGYAAAEGGESVVIPLGGLDVRVSLDDLR